MGRPSPTWPALAKAGGEEEEGADRPRRRGAGRGRPGEGARPPAAPRRPGAPAATGTAPPPARPEEGEGPARGRAAAGGWRRHTLPPPPTPRPSGRGGGGRGPPPGGSPPLFGDGEDPNSNGVPPPSGTRLGAWRLDLSLRIAKHDPVGSFVWTEGWLPTLMGGRGGGKRGQLARRHAWPNPPPHPSASPPLPSRLSVGTVFGGPLWMRDTPLPCIAPSVGAGGGGWGGIRTRQTRRSLIRIARHAPV